jgi:hypothetical protein
MKVALASLLLMAACQPIQTINACIGGWFPIHAYPDDKVPNDVAGQIRAENAIGESHCGWPKQ